MTDAPERIWITADDPNYRPFVTKGVLAGPPRTEYIRADIAEAEIERLRAALQIMDDTIVARFELFVSDQECLFNLRDRIRRALTAKDVKDE